MSRKELPWDLVHRPYDDKVVYDGPPRHGPCCTESGYFVYREEAEMFAELVRRVLDKDDFTEFAKKCQKEIFEG